MKEYNDKSYLDALNNIIGFSADDYTVSVDQEDFNLPSVLERIKLMRDLDNQEILDSVARKCLLFRSIVVRYKGEQVGPVILFNDVNTPWDSFEALKTHPLALNTIYKACVAFILKNSVPPSKNTQATEGEIGAQKK